MRPAFAEFLLNNERHRMNILTDLYRVIKERRAEQEEGSYTAYLFGAGLDKMLKKLGEETAETILAAKNLEAAPGGEARDELVGEVCDLLYHLTVALCELGVGPEEIEETLRGRMQKTGNLKVMRETDRNT
jgi:phosphoribosyl-ATP pyrophosphohydrolase